MRVLLSTVGTRGDVQPVQALALEVRALGHEVRVAVPPDGAAVAPDGSPAVRERRSTS